MKIQETPLKGCYIIEPTIFEDERGYLYESFNQRVFQDKLGIQKHFVQDNLSKSSYGVVRGIHLQKGEHAQAKLVTCLEGKVWDVAVDLRVSSSTFGKWFGIELNTDNKRQLYIPRGFGHGFSVLSETAIIAYKCDNFYHQSSEGGVIWNDAELAIDWKLPEKEIILSEKDKKQQPLRSKNF